jgi:DNA-binding transcriptional LysR family regulator
VQHLLTYDVPAKLTVNNYFGVLQAVISSLGIGVLPDYIIEDFPTVVRVLPEIESNEVPVFLAYPEELRQSKRVAAFRDFVQEEIIAHRRQRRAMGDE